MLHYGVGASPALWDLNLTPMVFVPNFQFLGSFQSNNIGKNIRTQFSDRLNDAGTPSRDWLRIPGLPAPRFASGRWMDNTSHAGSLNVLTKSEKELELKLNTSLVLDKQERHGNKSMEYLLGNERITYMESTDNFFQKNEFSASLQAIKNTRKTYLKNVLSIDREWLTNEGNNLRTAQQFNQAHTSGSLNLQNGFQNIFIRNGLKYNLYSNADYYQSRQSLSVQYTGTDSLAHPVQDFHIRDFHLHNYLDLSKKIGRITLSGRIGSEISISNIESWLAAHTVQHSTVNDFAWNSYKNYLSLNTSFQKNHWRFSLITPLSLNNILYRDRLLNTTDRFNKLLLEPMLVARLKPKASTELMGNIGYKNALARLGDIYSGYVMTDYLNVIQKNAGFRNNHNYLANLSVNHNDALSGITFSTRYTYSRMVQNVLAETRLNADGSKQVSYTERTNFNNSHTLAADFSKYLFNLKTSARLGLNYTLMDSQQMINEVFDTYTYQVFTPSAGFSFNHLRWMDFYYNSALTLSQNRNNKSQALQHDQKASLGLSTFKNTYLKFTFEHYRLKSEEHTRNFSFGDILIRYTFPKIKQDLELGLNNVLNQHQFYSIAVTDISVQRTTFQLRPRQVMVRGRIRI